MKANEILLTAHSLVTGDRNKQNGNVKTNHENIALLWTAYRREKYTPLDVALMMSLLKIARIKSGDVNDDDFVDGAGYLGIAGELASPEDEHDGMVPHHGYHP